MQPSDKVGPPRRRALCGRRFFMGSRRRGERGRYWERGKWRDGVDRQRRLGLWRLASKDGASPWRDRRRGRRCHRRGSLRHGQVLTSRLERWSCWWIRCVDSFHVAVVNCAAPLSRAWDRTGNESGSRLLLHRGRILYISWRASGTHSGANAQAENRDDPGRTRAGALVNAGRDDRGGRWSA